MCVGEIFEECFSNWLGWIHGKRDALPPTEIMDESIYEDDPEIIILDEVYNWLVHPKGKKERKEYHIYMAWVSIVALLKNQFYPQRSIRRCSAKAECRIRVKSLLTRITSSFIK